MSEKMWAGRSEGKTDAVADDFNSSLHFDRRMYRQDIAIAPVDHTVNRVTAAQAADELLNIAGINTSFVLYPDGDRVVVSARSINDTNVQVILEALGGGGNAGAAGAQIAGQTLKQVTESLMATLERYFKTDDPEEMGEEEE